ncbi:MAG: hypothetical protein H7844_11360 [Nitrospirae bacterium YQR-1]
MKRILSSITAAVILLTLTIVCTQLAAADDEDMSTGTYYTSYNLWFERSTAWSLNYKKGSIIAAGTEVYNIDIKPEYIQFQTKSDNVRHYIKYYPVHHGNMSPEAFAKRLFTKKPFEILVTGLTEEEIKSIKGGVVTAGMTKRAVLISYGYPPEHVTPSLEKKKWTYWYATRKKKVLAFDDNGLSVTTTSPKEDDESQ